MTTRSPGPRGGGRSTTSTDGKAASKRGAAHRSGTAAKPAVTGPVTGADVARAAGVSRATVSYAMNDTADARIPEETRRRVREIARELGYEPRSDARSLRRGHTDLVVLPTYTIPFGGLLTAFVNDLSRELHRLGHTLVTYGDPDADPMAAARAWAALRPAAIVVLPERLTEESAAYLAARDIAIVGLAWGQAPMEGVHFVLEGETGRSGYVAAEHLIAQGHRDIAVVIPREGRDDVIGLATLGRERLKGVREAVAAAPHPVRVRIVEMAESPASAAEVVAGWASDDRPDAVFGYNDEYAALLMGALSDAGIRVPDDIAMTGTDDLPLCEMVRPRLTSVGFTPAITLGAVAQRIADAVRSPVPDEPKRVIMWRAELRPRDSA